MRLDDCSPVPVDALRRSVDAGFGTSITELGSLVAVPGIAWQAFDQSELERSAALAASLFSGSGIEDVRILRASGPGGMPGGPAVLARKPAAPGYPTVLLYAHHDVQPPGDPLLWHSPAFTAVERDGRLFGRGVADDKAGIIMHLAAFRAVEEVLGSIGLGLAFFIEGEEEAGSPTLAALLREYEDLLRADVIVVADSGNWQVGVPALTTSLRGLIDATIEVRILDHGLHSGTFGGPVLDALTLLARLIASFHDGDGEVAVAGLPAAPDPALDISEEQYRADSGLRPGARLAGSGSITARLWSKPALSVIGLDAPGVAVASNTLVPAASAKVSLRLAPGTDPAAAMEALRRHVHTHAPLDAEVLFTPGSMTAPFAADTAAEAAAGALWAMRQAWSVDPVEMGVGGSVPVVAEFRGRFPHAQVLITGAEDPDSRAHGANESIHLGDFRNGILAEALLLARLNKPH